MLRCSHRLPSQDQVMLSRLKKAKPELVKQKISAFPRMANVGDYFTGTGAFCKVTEATVNALACVFPKEAKNLTASWLNEINSGQKNRHVSTCNNV